MRRRGLAGLVRVGGFVAVVATGCAAGSTLEPALGVSSAEPTKADGGSTSTPLPEPEEETAPSDAGTSTKKDAAPSDASSGTPEAGPADAAPASDGGAVVANQGDLVISEVMFNPSGTEPESEWIEIHNPTGSPVQLSGLVLRDGASPANTHTIGPGVVVAPGAYVVLVANAAAATTAKVPAASVVYEYNGAGAVDPLQLGNSANGAVVLLRGATEIARARYGALGFGGAGNGRSVQLSVLTYAGAGQSASWCVSSSTWAGSTDQGTPGAPDDCP